MEQLKVFLSSRSADNAQWREAAAKAIDSAGHETIWLPEGDTKSRYKRDYMDQLAVSHIVVYLVDQPSDAVSEEITDALNRGMPVIMLAHRGTNSDGDAILTDYVKHLRHDAPVMLRAFESLSNLEALVKTSIEDVIARRFDEPRQPIRWGGDIYQRIARSISKVNWRFGFTQETSTLILGPDRARSAEETSFLNAFYGLVDRLPTDPHLEVLHIFDLEATARAVKAERLLEPKDVIHKQTKHWCDRLRAALEADTSGRLHIKGVPPRLSPLMLADASLMVGHHIGPQSRRGSFHSEVGEWSNDTWEQLTAAAQDDGQDVLEFLRENDL